MPADDFFAPPPFNADSALASLRRTLRELKLVERDGTYELKGQAIARARKDGAVLKLEIVRRPSSMPEWERLEAHDHAVVRRFVDDLRVRMLRWDDSREE